jgi:hypothetical protein
VLTVGFDTTTYWPGQLSGGYYVDENADGMVDAVYLKFKKEAPIDSMSVSLYWPGAKAPRMGALSGASLSYGAADRATVRVAVPDAAQRANGIKTAGRMSATVQFTAFINDNRTAEVIDAAAPVIDRAIYGIGTPANADQPTVDTLHVWFSERVRPVTDSTPFTLFGAVAATYAPSMELLSLQDKYAVFIVEGVISPKNGDSIFINPISAVGDSLTWQNNPANRRVILSVERTVNWTVIVTPNPFNPDQYLGKGAAIRIVNPGNSKIPADISDAAISIYDAVGNSVVKSAPFEKGASDFVYWWKGTNNRGRKVGTGVYLGIVTVKDNGSKGTKMVKIGVRF